MTSFPATPQQRRGLVIVIAVFLAGYAVFLAWYHSPYAAGSDTSGYLNSARLLLDGQFATPVRVPAGMPRDLVSPLAFMPMGFRLDATAENLVPTYPVGMPLHFLAWAWLTGLGPATTLVSVGTALAFTVLLYLTAREFGVRPPWALGLALLGALSPLTIQYALHPMSDLPAAAWTLAAFLAALRAARHAGWAAAAGAAFATAVLLRPTSLLLIAPLAFALPWRWRAWVAFGLGGLPGALLLAAYNHRLYGTFFTTGYGNVLDIISAGYIPRTLRHYARWIPVVATPLVLGAVLLPWLRLDWRRKVVLALWPAVLVGFYSAYDPSWETWWYLRFILPALPALGIAAALGLQQFPFFAHRLELRLQPPEATPPASRPDRALRLSVGLMVAALAVVWAGEWTRTLRATKLELDERTYPLTADWLNTQLPADAVLVAYQLSGAILYYTDRAFLAPQHIAPDQRERLDRWLAAHKRPLYAAVFPHEEEFLHQNLPGRWERIATIRQTGIWRRTAP